MRTAATVAAVWTVALVSTAPAAPDATLTGTVLAADSTPAAGATVWAAQHSYGPLVRQETVADAAGRFRLAVGPGQWYVWARRDTQGGEIPGRRLAVTAGTSTGPVTIRLEERGAFRGRLLEAETGKPVPGGQLFLDAGLVLTADADGRFRVGGLARTHHEAFVAAAGRLRMRVLFDTTAKADTELDVPVPRGDKIVGRVTDALGKPIPGAYVGRGTSGSYFSTNGLYQACDADGRFVYDGVTPDQPARLEAGAPGYVSDEKDELTPPAAGRPVEVHFKLRPKPADKPDLAAPADERRRAVAGTVRGPDGKPVVGTLVLWGYSDYVGTPRDRTDADGRFRLIVPDKADVIAVLPRAHLPQFLKVDAEGDQAVQVTLAEGHTARGRVANPDGTPIRDVRVVPVMASPIPGIGNPYWLSESAARTDADGRFEVNGVPEQARFDFLKPGLSDLRNQPLQLDRPDNTVTMVGVGAIGGKAVDQAGKPVRSFRVLVGFPQERRPGDKTEGYFAGYSGTGVRFTSDDGTFVLTGVGAGSVYRITVQAEGRCGAVVDRVTAVPANVAARMDGTVFRLGPPTRLRIRATAGDKPVSGALVTLVNGQPGLDRSFVWGPYGASWEDKVRGRTDADGVADFPALEFDGATVLVEAPGYARHRLGWRDGAKDLAVELTPEAVLSGDVRNAAGEPVKGCYITLLGSGDQIPARVRSEDNGRFRIAELPAGEWRVLIRAADGRTQLYTGQVMLKSGETTELAITAKGE